MADIRLRAHGQTNQVIGHFAGLPKRLRNAIIEGTEEATDILYRHSVDTIRKGEGRDAGGTDRIPTWQTIRKEVHPTTRGAQGNVWSDDPVAEGLNKGVPPHTILPRNARALRFETGGRVVYAKRVEHPGFAGDNWVARARESAERDVRRLYDSRVERAIRE